MESSLGLRPFHLSVLGWGRWKRLAERWLCGCGCLGVAVLVTLLPPQRKVTAQQTLMRKHRLKDAMETMRVTNRFQDIDAVL